MAKKKFYLSAPQDDVGFLANLKKSHAEEIRKIPSRERLIEITRSEGIDIATGIFYLSLFEDPMNAVWIKKMEAQPVAAATVNEKRGKVFVIPAMFYKEFPEVGGHGPHITEIARQCGFDAELLETCSPGPLHKNVEIIYEAIGKDPSDRIWLVSLSRGGLEVRLAIEKYGKDFPFHKVKGWINTCGFPTGSTLTDINLETWQGRIRWWVIGKIMKCDVKFLEQMGEKAHAHKPFPQIPASLKVINVIPFARQWHVQMSLIGRFKTLTRYGPNDGITTTRSSLIDGYPTYPLWAADHFFRNDKVVPLLYRLFHAIGEA
jgi:hypothetical protein